jgi:uncharacterized protein (DUF1330 family)
MPVYLILDNTIHDPAKYDAYKRAVPAIVAKHGGEYLARDAVNAFMGDPEHQPWKKLRESAATTNNLLLVEGL